MLARRELSSVQVRERLMRKGFTKSEIEDALRRLEAEGALDDRRTAAAYAHESATVKFRGRARTLQELQARGISRLHARAAVDHAYASLDEGALLDRAVRRRLDGKIHSRTHLRHLYQALLRQGFDGTAIAKSLRSKTNFDPGQDTD